MPSFDLGVAMRLAEAAGPASVTDVVEAVASAFSARDVVVYLADFGQSTLEPLPDRRTHSEIPARELIPTSMAGRCFSDQQAITAERGSEVRVWVPVTEGSDRSGVLALTVPEAPEATVHACEELGLFTGYLIATNARFTDLFNLYRRRRPLSLEASMQWDLLPPVVLKSKLMTVAGLVEPAYDVGGDCFDYALNDTVLELGVFDPMGHGLQASLVAALAVGSYRHDRREARDLSQIYSNLDAAVAQEFGGQVFSTGLLARIDLESGEMAWLNAGHHAPILLRGEGAVDELSGPRGLPWGLGALTDTGGPELAIEALEPGDSVLFFTDGVVEAHSPGIEQFGLERLIDLAGRHTSEHIEPEEIVRRLTRAVLDYQGDQLGDDATLVLFRWNGSDDSHDDLGRSVASR